MSSSLAVNTVTRATSVQATDAPAAAATSEAEPVVLAQPLGLPTSADVAARMQGRAQASEAGGIKPTDLPHLTARYPEVEAKAKKLLTNGQLGEPITNRLSGNLEKILIRDMRPVDGPLVEALVMPGVLESMPPQRSFYLQVTPSGFRLPGSDGSPRVYGPFRAVITEGP